MLYYGSYEDVLKRFPELPKHCYVDFYTPKFVIVLIVDNSIGGVWSGNNSEEVKFMSYHILSLAKSMNFECGVEFIGDN